MITLVIGGVRSGKSRWAQDMAAKARNVVFLATAEAMDDEMRAKIARHRRERPAHWRTVEVPVELDMAISEYGSQCEVLLVDCLTTFTANLMEAEQNNADKIMERVDRLCHALHQAGASVVLVSNEAGSGVVPFYESGRQFRDLLGEVNQKIARIAGKVVLMVAGCPVVIKEAAGTAP